MNRRDARQAALCMIFNIGFNFDQGAEQTLDLYIENLPYSDESFVPEDIKNDDYFKKVYFGVCENIERIDEIIKDASKKWSMKRISKISVSILRLALFEMLYCDDIPNSVSINEAVELSKKYDNDDSYTFINGILGAAQKNIEQNKD